MRIKLNLNVRSYDLTKTLKNTAKEFKEGFTKKTLKSSTKNIIDGYFKTMDKDSEELALFCEEVTDIYLEEMVEKRLEEMNGLKRAFKIEVDENIGELPPMFSNILGRAYEGMASYEGYGRVIYDQSEEIEKTAGNNIKPFNLDINEVSQRMAFLNNQSLYGKGVK